MNMDIETDYLSWYGNTFISPKSELPKVFIIKRGCILKFEMTAQSAECSGRHKCMAELRFKPLHVSVQL